MVGLARQVATLPSIERVVENKIAGLKLSAANAYIQLSGRQSSVAFLARNSSCEFLSRLRFMKIWMCPYASQLYSSKRSF